MLYSLKNVSKIYGAEPTQVKALKNLTVDIPERKIIVVLGASGSGKSTFLNLLGGMDVPTSGQICFRGNDISHFSSKQLTKFRRLTVGFVFQSYNLLPNLNSLENVAVAASMAKLPRSVAVEALTSVGLSDRMKHFPRQLSGGEQQRVAIARGLAKQPRVLLCDEPTGALDFETGVQVLDVLQRMREHSDTTVILITHNKDIAKIGDMVITLASGEITQIEYNDNPLSALEVQW